MEEGLAAGKTEVLLKAEKYVRLGDLFRVSTAASSVEGVKLNVTALLTVDQVVEMADVLRGGPASYISVFAGRIADTGRDPVPLMAAALAVVRTVTACELIWASPREVLNIVQADQIGCDVITVTNDLLAKVSLFGKDLRAYSLDTVRMFREDAVRAGYQI